MDDLPNDLANLFVKVCLQIVDSLILFHVAILIGISLSSSGAQDLPNPTPPSLIKNSDKKIQRKNSRISDQDDLPG